MKKLFLFFFFIQAVNTLFSQEKRDSFEIYFEFNSVKLLELSEKKLVHFLNQLNVREYIVSIHTSCDSVGTKKYNDILSNKRLSAISERFKSSGITTDKLVSSGEILDRNKNLMLNRKAVIYYETKKNNVVNEIPPTKVNFPSKYQKILTEKSYIEPIVLNIQFVPGEAVFLNETSYSEANDLYVFLKENKNISALIRGHVCCKNDSVLSVQRAYSVYDFLIKRSIDPARLDFKGYSNKMPIVYPEYSEEERQKNRRVDVIFTIGL